MQTIDQVRERIEAEYDALGREIREWEAEAARAVDGFSRDACVDEINRLRERRNALIRSLPDE